VAGRACWCVGKRGGRKKKEQRNGFILRRGGNYFKTWKEEQCSAAVCTAMCVAVYVAVCVAVCAALKMALLQGVVGRGCSCVRKRGG